jgi:hypothetical protein
MRSNFTNALIFTAICTISATSQIYAKPLPPTVPAGKQVVRNYPRGDAVSNIGTFCKNENLQGDLCVLGAGSKAWDTALSRTGYSMKDTLEAISQRGQLGMLEYDAIGMGEILMPFFALTDTPGGMDLLVAHGMINPKDVPAFMALTGKTAGKLTGTAQSNAVTNSNGEDVLNYTCGNKALKLYATSKAAFIDTDKADDMERRRTTTGYLIDFRMYAEMGGTFTQYQLASINDKITLTSQWLNADGDPLRASDVTPCTKLENTKGKLPSTKSTLEKIRAGELD